MNNNLTKQRHEVTHTLNPQSTIHNPPTWSLTNLLEGIVVHKLTKNQDQEISGIALDSRKIKPGFLFFAFKGHNADGHDYIKSAIENGAVAVICEDKSKIEFSPTVPVIEDSDIVSKISIIADKFFHHPSTKLKVIAVTGTNGKTSISQLTAAALTNLGMKTGVIGTLGMGFPNQLDKSANTTPDSVTIQQKFAEFLENGAQAVAMEVSSHAISEKRIANIHFDTAIFTNLTQDHLDYHHTMDEYWQVKRSLFFTPGLKRAIINIDDEHGFSLVKELADDIEVFAYSNKENNISNNELPKNVKLINATNIKLKPTGITAKITTPWGEAELKSRLIGDFNVSNLLAILTAVVTNGVSLEQALKTILKLEPIPGRMQTFGGNKKPLVIVDYAHTPDALEKALSAIRPHCKGQIWCVFGCGGDRDRIKRPIMAQIAERLSDQLIITQDNSRSESPKQIIQDITEGLTCPWAAQIEPDRATAIAYAINCATEKDVVLIAGKGHENYQIIGNKRFHFSDQEEVEKSLN